MISYPLPGMEQQRKEILQRFSILTGQDNPSCAIATETMARVFNVPVAVIWPNERYREWFYASYGLSTAHSETLHRLASLSQLAQTSFAVPDIREDPYFSRHLTGPEDQPTVFFAGAPLRDPDGKRLGTICISDHKPRELGHEETATLEHFAQLLSQTLCMQSAARYAIKDLIALEEDRYALYDLATTDPLTGAFNRRSFFHFGNREARRAQRHGIALTVMMLDLDHFKRVNDVHGHGVGDVVLKAFGQAILAEVREEDMVGRLGGEEFAVLLPETKPKDAIHLARRLRQRINRLQFPGVGGPFSVTTSMGLAAYERGDNEIDQALERADHALYEAKRAGRDRVMLAPTRECMPRVMA